MISRLLLSGRLAEAVANTLATRLPELSVRARQQPEPDDLAWADSYSAFQWPESARAVSFDWAHSMGAGVDTFLDHKAQIGVLTRTIGRMPERMGTFVLALLLERSHHLAEYAQAQRRREWHPRNLDPLPQRATVLGTGAVAAGIAGVLTRHGLEVTGVNRSGRPAAHFTTVVPWAEKGSALDGCPLLVLALPASRSTVGIVDEAVLDRLASAQLVNVGRGSTLNLAALQRALAEGTVTRAHLDVFEREPLDAGSWLWTHPAVRITPHVAAVTTVDEAAEAIAVTYEDLRAGRTPASLVTDRG